MTEDVVDRVVSAVTTAVTGVENTSGLSNEKLMVEVPTADTKCCPQIGSGIPNPAMFTTCPSSIP
jgi:hypothetical protein